MRKQALLEDGRVELAGAVLAGHRQQQVGDRTPLDIAERYDGKRDKPPGNPGHASVRIGLEDPVRARVRHVAKALLALDNCDRRGSTMTKC